MKLFELLAVMHSDTVVKVVDVRSISVFHGEVCITGTEIPERYKFAAVLTICPEYFKGWGKTGITITVQP